MSEPFTALAGLASREEQQQRILAIDPGPTQSAYVLTVGGSVRHPGNFGKVPNAELLANLREWRTLIDVLVIEQVASYGMAVGQEVFETVYWSGRFAEAAHVCRVERLTRKAVVTHICNASKANDSNLRAALIDRYGGQLAAIGNKANPGPLHGMNSDHRAALAVALTWADQHAEAER